jgi:TRAP-type C4-dicarboxylate transport system permease large subunit
MQRHTPDIESSVSRMVIACVVSLVLLLFAMCVCVCVCEREREREREREKSGSKQYRVYSDDQCRRH